jgi:Na+-transporting methylmalonyl-CoA/oxaloacetate decarboxylase gamma subunit
MAPLMKRFWSHLMHGVGPTLKKGLIRVQTAMPLTKCMGIVFIIIIFIKLLVVVMQVCGMLVEQATHKEVVSIIKDRTNLNLKVRSGGLLPVKENRSNPIHWQIIKVSSYLHILADYQGILILADYQGQEQLQPQGTQRLPTSV